MRRGVILAAVLATAAALPAVDLSPHGHPTYNKPAYRQTKPAVAPASAASAPAPAAPASTAGTPASKDVAVITNKQAHMNLVQDAAPVTVTSLIKEAQDMREAIRRAKVEKETKLATATESKPYAIAAQAQTSMQATGEMDDVSQQIKELKDQIAQYRAEVQEARRGDQDNGDHVEVVSEGTQRKTFVRGVQETSEETTATPTHEIPGDSSEKSSGGSADKLMSLRSSMLPFDSSSNGDDGGSIKSLNSAHPSHVDGTRSASSNFHTKIAPTGLSSLFGGSSTGSAFVGKAFQGAKRKKTDQWDDRLGPDYDDADDALLAVPGSDDQTDDGMDGINESYETTTDQGIDNGADGDDGRQDIDPAEDSE